MSPAPAKRADTPPAPVPAELPPVELTAEAKKKLREQARREAEAKFKATEVERLMAAKTGAAPPPKVAPGAPAAEPVDPNRTDAMRAADAAVFLRGVLWPVLSVLALFTPWELAELTEAMSKEDGAAWVPVARRYRWVDLLITWAGVPARLVARVRSLAVRRKPKQVVGGSHTTTGPNPPPEPR